ncbi:MAG: dTMP kinase [Rhodobacteraceae bacterium]|nr:dTMP kinase [Paracoccaceae bacterium]
MFITFEGIDGSGKSTQVKYLANRLTTLGREVVLTREPGGSTGAEEIRSLVLEGAPERWSAETEILLFTAARRDHMEKLILPALEDGKIVICDRFADSTRMYQGLTRGDLRATVDSLTDLMIKRQPDLTILIDMDPELGHQRAKARKQSLLEDIPGVGAKRRRELLRHFGSAKAVENASVEELSKIKGISASVARTIYDYLHTVND